MNFSVQVEMKELFPLLRPQHCAMEVQTCPGGYPSPTQAQLSHGTWFQHILRQRLTVEGVSGGVEQVPQDD